MSRLLKFQTKLNLMSSFRMTMVPKDPSNGITLFFLVFLYQQNDNLCAAWVKNVDFLSISKIRNFGPKRINSGLLSKRNLTIGIKLNCKFNILTSNTQSSKMLKGYIINQWFDIAAWNWTRWQTSKQRMQMKLNHKDW